MTVDTNSLRYLLKRSSKNCDLQFANILDSTDIFKENCSIDDKPIVAAMLGWGALQSLKKVTKSKIKLDRAQPTHPLLQNISTGLGLFWDDYKKILRDLDPPTHFHGQLGFLEFVLLCKAPDVNHPSMAVTLSVPCLSPPGHRVCIRGHCYQAAGLRCPRPSLQAGRHLV